ncbi:uncharacterized protein EKO05_0000834 [Ascochyta rabiei]|uniref:uncharacterized protein n=1 Tax=Didymella rabiei TaxID=5454 RepID=UPI0021FF6DD5|nr:uncharacterized protein EKO05_0000834 [Ascochyta rabiei]UPX10163.1 hypothetical protein EKO05_0000834 [Ascochyta rabiei]
MSTSAPINDDSLARKLGAEYDCVIFGGGLSGLVVTNRLTENRKSISLSVLVVENGVIDDQPASRVPSIEGFPKPLGTFWTPNTIDNSTKKRCYARFAYCDPIQKRSTLHLLTSTHVNEILFESCGKLAASGAKITNNGNALTTCVYAAKEVILAAGGIFTPHLLLLSGIGPKDVLSAANISIKRELPAALGRGNAAAFLAFKQFSSKYHNVTGQISKQDATACHPERYSKNEALSKGFFAQRKILIEHYLSDNAATGEYSIQPWGRATTAVQKPLSRGTLTLNTMHLLANTIVVRNAFQNPVDKQVLGKLVRWNRKHWAKQPLLQRYSPVETVPGVQYQTDEEIFDASTKAAALDPAYARSSGYMVWKGSES